jgi:hypothetical protein
MKTEVGRHWYQSIHFDELSCRQVSFSGPQWTPSREEQKRFKRPLHTLTISQPVGFVIFLSDQKLMFGFSDTASVGVQNHNSWRWYTFLTNQLDGSVCFFVNQWEQSSDDKKMREIKWRKKYILGYLDAAQLQRRNTNAVMITADVLTTHFGLHRPTLRSYSVGAPTL